MNGMLPEREALLPAAETGRMPLRIGPVRAAAPAVSTDLREVQKLEDSFKAFSQVTRDLEAVYRRIEVRAAGVDQRLRDTNRRLLERVGELQHTTEDLNGILDAIPSGIVTCDAECAIRRVNAAAERILGRRAVELDGRDVRTLKDHRGQAILLLGNDAQTAGVTVGRLVGCFDGSTRYLSGTVADLPGGGRLEVVSDQTEVLHLRTQVNRLDTLAALGEMAAGVAHEIRNPMSAVEGFAGLLERALGGAAPVETDQLLRYADRIRRGVAEVNGIITDLLLWARPEKPAFSAVRLADLLEEVVADARISRRGGGGVMLLTAVEPKDAAVSVDRLRMKLLLGNLVRNALDAVGSKGRVELKAKVGKKVLEIQVDDDGPGIAPELGLRLFRPFASTKPEGTGLGLALVRKYVELHGGDIAVETGPLGGARFLISIPVPETGGNGQ